MPKRSAVWSASFAVAGLVVAGAARAAETGFVPIFNGRDLSGWKVPDGDNGHWKVVDGVIDYDAAERGDRRQEPLDRRRSTATSCCGVDWRIKETPYVNPNVPIIRPTAPTRRAPTARRSSSQVPDSDSGIYLRGSSKSQVNIWCWPIGSGEVYGYRMDTEACRPRCAPASRRKTNADKDVGRVEHVRDHDEGRPAHGRAQRRAR